MAVQFLDTNILLRHLLQDHPEQSPRCTAFLASVERREIEVRISDLVVFETVFVLERTYKKPRGAVRDAVLPLVQLPGVLIPGKRAWPKVFDLYVSGNISFADAYHAVLMGQAGIEEIVSFGRDFERVPGVRRLEP